jgi:hypothetical protein
MSLDFSGGTGVYATRSLGALLQTPPFAFALWFRAETIFDGSGYAGLFSTSPSNQDGAISLEIEHYDTYTSVNFWTFNVNIGSWDSASPNLQVFANKWYLVVCNVFADGSKEIFLPGAGDPSCAELLADGRHRLTSRR